MGWFGWLKLLPLAAILGIGGAALFVSSAFATNLPSNGPVLQVGSPAPREPGPIFGTPPPAAPPGAPVSPAVAPPTVPGAPVLGAVASSAPAVSSSNAALAPGGGGATVSVILAPDARGPLPPAVTMPASQVPPSAVAPGAAGRAAGANPPGPDRLAPNAAASPSAARLLAIAQAQLGARYTWAGTSPATGFDCSGLIYYVFSTYGYRIDRLLPGQRAAGRPVRREELRPGDLVFFENTYTPGLSHDGIYVGDGKFIHAADESSGVVLTPLGAAYWDQRYAGAVRILD